MFQEKGKIKLLKPNKSVPVEKGQRGGDSLAGLALGSDLRTERERTFWKSLDFIHFEREWERNRSRKHHGQEELPGKEGWGESSPFGSQFSRGDSFQWRLDGSCLHNWNKKTKELMADSPKLWGPGSRLDSQKQWKKEAEPQIVVKVGAKV